MLKENYKTYFQMKRDRCDKMTTQQLATEYLKFFYYMTIGYFTDNRLHNIYLRTTKRFIECN